MLHVHVRHYLTLEGLKYFDSWIHRVKTLMSQQEGFVAVSSESKKGKGYGYVHVVFDSEKHLMQWVEHPEHDSFIAELDPYRSQSSWEFYKTKDDRITDDSDIAFTVVDS